MSNLIKDNIVDGVLSSTMLSQALLTATNKRTADTENTSAFYLTTGITDNDVVFAYNPKTASNLEDSYLNLVRNTHTLHPLNENNPPTLITNVGWKFSNASLCTDSLDISELYTILILTTIENKEFTVASDYYFMGSSYYKFLNEETTIYKAFSAEINTGDSAELLPVVYCCVGLETESISPEAIVTSPLSMNEFSSIRVIGVNGDGLYINGELYQPRTTQLNLDIITMPYLTFGMTNGYYNEYADGTFEEYVSNEVTDVDTIIQAIVLYNKKLTAEQILAISSAMQSL